MFTGIVEAVGEISSVETDRENKIFWVESPFSSELRADQSLNHNGVCLTIEEIDGSKHRVSAIKETLEKTTLSQWKKGQKINLERAMSASARFDGHIVQGHVDATAFCVSRKEAGGSWEFIFQFDRQFAANIIEKGSICINGVSLTVYDITFNRFNVSIIPFTYSHTTFSTLNEGDSVNIEFDMMGKYLQRFLEVRNQSAGNERIFSSSI